MLLLLLVGSALVPAQAQERLSAEQPRTRAEHARAGTQPEAQAVRGGPLSESEAVVRHRAPSGDVAERRARRPATELYEPTEEVQRRNAQLRAVAVGGPPGAEPLAADVLVHDEVGYAENRPAMATDTNGTLWLAFEDASTNGSGQQGISLYRSSNHGATWSFEIYIYLSSGGELYKPSITTANGYILVTYQYDTGGFGVWRYDQTQGVSTFYTPGQPSVTGSILSMRITDDSEDYPGGAWLYLAYLYQEDGGAIGLYVTNSQLTGADTGTSWSAAQRLDDASGGFYTVYNGLGYDYGSGRLYLAYLGAGAAQNNVLLRTSDDLGATFTTATTLSAASGLERYALDVAAEGSNALVVYTNQDASTSNDDVHGQISTDGGTNWSGWSIDVTTAYYAWAPEASTSGTGDFYVAYCRSTDASFTTVDTYAQKAESSVFLGNPLQVSVGGAQGAVSDWQPGSAGAGSFAYTAALNGSQGMYAGTYGSDGNNDAVTATVVSVPHTGSYDLDPYTIDIDWYRVFLTGGESYRFETDSAIDPEFYLYGPGTIDGSSTGPFIAENDDGGVGLNPLIEYTPPSTGYYHLRVAYYANNPLDENPPSAARTASAERKRQRDTSEPQVTNPYTLRIELAGSPDISVAPTSLSATAAVGATTTQTLTVNNVGTQDLTWSIAAQSGSATGWFPSARARRAATSVDVSALQATARQRGRVPVLIHLNTDFQPEALLSRQASAAQRQQFQVLQDDLLAAVQGLAVEGVKRFTVTPMLALTVGEDALGRLAAHPAVLAIEEDIPVSPSLAQSTGLIGAPTAWGLGYDGTGQTVAILDTGVDSTHPFLTGRVVAEACYSSNVTGVATSVCPNGQTSQTGAGAGRECSFSRCDHGTHVAGIAAGKGTSYSGVAPEANIIAVQVFSRFDDPANCSGSAPCPLAYRSDIILGLDYVYSLRTTYNIAAANMSLGGGRYTSYCDTDGRKPSIDNLRAAGIATAISSGNSAYSDAMGAPACISSAISVGSTGDGSFGATQDVVSSFSNSVSFLSLLAPGSIIESSVPGASYSNKSGTSMAAPHVAGAWAVLKQKFPTASVTEILDKLTTTGVPVTDSRNNVTKPRIQLDAALNTGGTTWLSVAPPSGTVQASGSASITVTFDATNLAEGSYTGSLVIASNDPDESSLTIPVSFEVTGGATYPAPILHLPGASIGLADRDRVGTWPDVSGHGLDATATKPKRYPLLRDPVAPFNNQPAVYFNTKTFLTLPNDDLLQNAGPYDAKTTAIVFRTAADVTDRQVIVEQGSDERGLAAYVHNGTLWVGAWNLKGLLWGPLWLSTPVETRTEYVLVHTLDANEG
ncbi:MAG: S8 family serine peptidase, partial [Bacteroidota bacterium]